MKGKHVPPSRSIPTSLALGLLLTLSPASGSVASSTQTPMTIFKGRPSFKVSEGGLERRPERITQERAINLDCVISRIGDSYYWASRQNAQFEPVDTGAFTTFLALNGSGYVRFIKPESKAAASIMSPTEETFDYVEHVVIGLRSVTYYGSRQ
jgi:hypothetical protein